MDVFISYARSTSRDQARLISAALKERGIQAFLDEREISHGQRFPVALSQAMHGARIILVLLSEAYIQKPWCAFELRIALAPYRCADGEAVPEHVIFGLPDDGGMENILPHLPPRLAATNWPLSRDTDGVADLIASRLPLCQKTLGERLDRMAPDLLDSLGSGGEVPVAGEIARLPGWHSDLPRSLRNRFYGRDAELWSLFHLLQIGEVTEGTRSCVISGGAGMGKTQLVAEFVHRYAPRYYRGGVVWIDADQDVHLASPPWRSVICGLGVTKFPAEATDRMALSELPMVIRQRFEQGPVLWVIDNLPDVSPGKKAPSLDRWCPVQNLVTLICTSRQPGISGCDTRIELGETGDDDAIRMLTDSGVSKSQLDERQWKDIVRWVGGMPLALQILNASLREGFCTPQELHTASRSTDAVAHLDGEFEVLVSEVPAGSIRGISMAFEISFEALQSQEAAMAAALQIARLSPVPIPDSLLSNIADRRILAQLKSRHWLLGDVEKRDNQVVGHWRMHRLTSSFLRSRSNDISRELCDLAKAITAALSHPELLEQIPSSRLLSHILKVLSDFVQIGIDKLSPESLAAARDLIRAGTFFRMDSPESDDLRNWTASFAVRFGVDGEIVDRLEALWTDIDRESWHRLLAVVRALKESRAAVPLLIRLLQVRSPQLQRAALWIAGFHELQNELVIPLLDLLLADFPERALEEPSPLKTDIMEYWGSPDPFWELPASQEIRDILESFARNDRFPAMIEAVKAKLSGSQPSDLLERRIDAYALCLRAHYTPLPFRVYSAGRWDPIEEIHLGSYSEFHTPAVRDVDEADFEPLVELILTAADENIVRHTVRRMVAFVVGANSLSRAAHGALDAGHPDRTLLIADQTLAVRKNFANGWWWRALALEEIGPKERLRDALAAYGRVVNLEPEFADARLRHASLALELGDFDRGLRSARILAKMEPDYGPAHYLQACALLNLERDEEALAAASEAVRLSPDDYQAWLFQALAYEQLDMPAEARIAAKKAADLDPENPEPRECLDRLG